ncbi:uncharacterized protein BDZ99DRAFT_460514 [Mytilinidion resinicola]|uniref:Uncharacterized protein n=1 Tax=Mytilinidion resinicola TaxID=574789 RepID=A0A6A6YZ79_9PEZI|nr:uncharacterized protein BDZ99DRAFT_460514 [Mytilinidion resinicola]KAF2813235.1 hypothetical protein BDZ99DRAFT_460514 [Mytilinidion resinicola]
MTAPEGALKVPGHNNATYGPVPKASQLFEIEFLEITPSPVPTDRIFFQLLRGEIPPSKNKDPAHLDKLLTSATLTITLSAILSNGEHEDETSYTVPLRTTGFSLAGQLSIRNSTGAYVEHLSSSGHNDILTDCQLPGMFIRTGTWTFKVVAELEDGTCLFAITLTQWLEGGMKD